MDESYWPTGNTFLIDHLTFHLAVSSSQNLQLVQNFARGLNT